MALTYVMYISGCKGEQLSLKVQIDSSMDKNLYACLFFNPPKVYNTFALRDSFSNDGGRGVGGISMVVFNSASLLTDLVNLMNKGQTIDTIMIAKIVIDKSSSTPMNVASIKHIFKGVSIEGIGMHYSETQTIFEGTNTNPYTLLTFNYDSYLVDQRRQGFDGDTNITKDGISNKFGVGATGAAK